MPKYEYPSYATIYCAELNGSRVYDTPTRSACFGESLGYFTDKPNNKAHYHIILVRDESWMLRQYKNHCRMTKHQLENYLRRIATIKPFKYSVKEGDYDGSSCFHLYVDMVATRKEATFILQCIKRTYEWPYSFLLEQAYHLQEIPEFKHDSILNLFNVAFSAFSAIKNSDHCFSGNTKFEKYATIRDRLPHVIYTSDVYPNYCNKTTRAPRVRGINYCGTWPSNPAQWTNELFQELLPTYVKNYKILKG